MNSFVFDENMNAPIALQACSSEGLCVISGYPAHLRQKKDREMLPEVLSGQRLTGNEVE